MTGRVAQRRIVALVDGSAESVARWLSIVPAAAALARAVGARLDAVLAGGDDLSGRAALVAGADHAFLVSHPDLPERPDPGQLAALFAAALAQSPLHGSAAADVILLPADRGSQEIAASLAVALDGAALDLCAELTLTERGIEASPHFSNLTGASGF
jgi:electron transfer flavoprotein alpha subunit